MSVPAESSPPGLEADWLALAAHASRLEDFSIARAFDNDPGRAAAMRIQACGLQLDYSRQRMDEQVQEALLKLADAADFDRHRSAFFAGERINTTEHRAALHMALRAQGEADFLVDEGSVMPEVQAVRERLLAFSESVRSGDWRGATGKRITTQSQI